MTIKLRAHPVAHVHVHFVLLRMFYVVWQENNIFSLQNDHTEGKNNSLLVDYLLIYAAHKARLLLALFKKKMG